MNDFKEIRLSDYGFFILSPFMMKSFLVEKKIKGKKILDKLDGDLTLYKESISSGVWLPITNVDAKKYYFITNMSHDNNKWEVTKKFGSFNLSVGDDNCVWLGSLVSLNSWDYNIFEKEKGDAINYKTLTGQVINKFLRFDVPKGLYEITLFGVNFDGMNGYKMEFNSLKKIEKSIDPREDGYNFTL